MSVKGFKIETGIEPPPPRGATRFPLSDMRPGTSFIVGKADVKTVRNAVAFWGFKYDQKFAVRKIDAANWRVWRLE